MTKKLKMRLRNISHQLLLWKLNDLSWIFLLVSYLRSFTSCFFLFSPVNISFGCWYFYLYNCFRFSALQIEKPLQRHGGRLEHNETYCGSCFGAEAVL